jgi:hypothetical protein
MNYRITVLLASGLVWHSFAHSHHNSASHYDLEKISQAEGVVTEYKMMNPHARIYFDVTDENGEVKNWMAEGDAAAVLLRRGWTGDELKPGDYIKITGNPSRDGSPIIEWRSIIRPDGSEILGGNAVPVERERAMDELERRRRERRAAETTTE